MDYFERIEKQLDLPQAERADVMRELRSHHAAIVDELKASGSSHAHAEQVAEIRLGEPEGIAARLSAAHNSASWKTALIAAFPCLTLIVLKGGEALWYGVGAYTRAYAVQAVLPLCCLTAIFMVGAVSGLRRPYRPAWLACWLAVALAGIAYSGQLLAGFACKLYFRETGLDRIQEYFAFQNLVRALPFVLLAAVTTAFYILTLKRRWRGVIWSVALVLAAWLVWRGLGGRVSSLILPSFLLYLLVLPSVAVAAFARHPAGRASDSVLFTFLGLAGIVIELPWRTVSGYVGLNMLYLVGLSVILVTVVILYARARSSAQKLRVLALGITAFFISQAAVLTSVIGMPMLAAVATCAVVTSLIAFAPPLIASRWSLRLTLARRE